MPRLLFIMFAHTVIFFLEVQDETSFLFFSLPFFLKWTFRISSMPTPTVLPSSSPRVDLGHLFLFPFCPLRLTMSFSPCQSDTQERLFRLFALSSCFASLDLGRSTHLLIFPPPFLKGALIPAKDFSEVRAKEFPSPSSRVTTRPFHGK